MRAAASSGTTDPPPSIAVRTRASHGYLGRRLWRRGCALLGGAMVTVSAATFMLIALIPAVLMMGLSGGGTADEGLSAQDRAIAGDLGKLWLLAVVITVSGWASGRRLLHGRRDMVLWLRRFRFGDATRVISAALDHIGRSWRVVTLHDSVVEPVGVPAPVRVSVGLWDAVGRLKSWFVRWVIPAASWAVRLAFVGLVVAPIWAGFHGALPQLLDELPGGRVGQPQLLQAWLMWVCGATLLIVVASFIAYIAVALALLPVFGVMVMLGQVRKDVATAEMAKVAVIRNPADVDSVASRVAVASRGVVAPRLTVLNVDAAVWRETVRSLARQATVVLIDVSEVSNNVVWEVEEMTRRWEARTVFVGRLDRVELIAGIHGNAADTDATPTAESSPLRGLLAGHEVLGYTTGLVGRLRFQRALFAELEDALPRRRPTLRDAALLGRLLLGIAAFAVSLLTTYALARSWLTQPVERFFSSLTVRS